jgi:hypothetical protein
MAEIHSIILLLMLFGIKHFFCDFVLQNSKMLSEKGIYGKWGGIQHALTHAFGTGLILVLFFNNLTFIFILYMMMFDGFVHYHVDWIKQKLNRGLTTADQLFWVWFGLDQCLHYLTYIVIIGWVVGVF